MSMSFHAYAWPVYLAGIAAELAMTDLVEAHVASWSPAMRQDCAMGAAHCHGLLTPHSHKLNKTA